MAMEAQGPLVSVIVVNHNRAELLRDCLASLAGQTHPRLEILVVDNGSTDHSREVVAQAGDSRIRLLLADRNLGFGVANNLAAKEASGQFLALLNNDAIADSRWVERLVARLAPDAAAGMCASKILVHGTCVIDKTGHLLYPDGQNRGRGTGEPDCGQYDQPGPALFPDGCAALYRRAAWEDVAGFDPYFFAYADDADFGLRCRLRGWECLYEPGAVVFHRRSATSGAYSAGKIYLVERNRFWLAVKSFPWPLLLASPLFTLNRWAWNVVAAALKRGAAGNFRRQASGARLITVLWRAYWDGLRGLRPMLAARRRIRATRRLTDAQFYRLLWRFRISAYKLAFEDISAGREG
jgi:GT2 family glycosyltransferase